MDSYLIENLLNFTKCRYKEQIVVCNKATLKKLTHTRFNNLLVAILLNETYLRKYIRPQ